MEIAGYFASTLMGLVLGMMGGGGSIMTVPILVYLFGVPPTTATGYSLFVVGVTALIGSLVYMKKGDIDYRSGISFALPSVTGVYLSRSVIVPSIPSVAMEIGSFSLKKDLLIMSAFAVLMIMASYSMLKVRTDRAMLDIAGPARFALVAVQGFIIGIVAGFVGAGGGFLILPSLVVVLGLKMRMAVGTSLLIIAFQSLLGFTGDLARGVAIDWSFLLSVAGIAAGGIVAGSSIAHRIQERKLKNVFGWFVLLMGSAILWEQIRHL